MQPPISAAVGEMSAAALFVRATFVLRRCIKSFFHCGMSGRKPVVPPSGVVAGDEDDDMAAASAPAPVPVPPASVKCSEGRFCCCSSEDIFGSSWGCKLHCMCLVHDSPRSYQNAHTYMVHLNSSAVYSILYIYP